MRIWFVRIVAVIMWLLATHGALKVVEGLSGRSWPMGAVAFIGVTAGMVWVAAHLGDAPFWRQKSGDESWHGEDHG